MLRKGLRVTVHLYAGHRDVQRALYSMAALGEDEAAGRPVRAMERDRAGSRDDQP